MFFGTSMLVYVRLCQNSPVFHALSIACDTPFGTMSCIYNEHNPASVKHFKGRNHMPSCIGLLLNALSCTSEYACTGVSCFSTDGRCLFLPLKLMGLKTGLLVQNLAPVLPLQRVQAVRLVFITFEQCPTNSICKMSF